MQFIIEPGNLRVPIAQQFGDRAGGGGGNEDLPNGVLQTGGFKI